MSLLALITQGGLVSQAVALLLLAMSVASWVVILWKAWLLQRAASDVARSTAAFWQSASVEAACGKMAAFDRNALVLPLVLATQARAQGTLAGAGDTAAQLTRVLRGALHAVLHKLQFGQILLATVGSTAPFVGLLGTVWGIYHALAGMATAGQVTIDKVAGPVGEALVMTAAGLVVAIPAVLAYNVFGRSIGRIEADLEGFAFDLRDLLSPTFVAARTARPPEGAIPPAAWQSQFHGGSLEEQGDRSQARDGDAAP
ncbi:MAG: MotA/TolQ/ExbB proton channel family protein [Polaromonas sp.]|nr:MotA/TolQ/ExbB proton channel family protein [Polaromonas sp.]